MRGKIGGLIVRQAKKQGKRQEKGNDSWAAGLEKGDVFGDACARNYWKRD